MKGTFPVACYLLQDITLKQKAREIEGRETAATAEEEEYFYLTSFY